MTEMRLVVGYKGVTKQVALDDSQAKRLVGLKIGQNIGGDELGFPGYELQIRGGTDKDGFPMRFDLQGAVRKKLLLSDKPGYKPKERGIRRRKMVHGNTIDGDIAQVNVAVVKAGKKPLEELVKNTPEK